MHSTEVRMEIAALVAAGMTDSEIARRTGVPRSTVRDLRRRPYVSRQPAARCPRCWRRMKPMSWSDHDYAYVLGLYLGDGNISRLERTWSFRLALDRRYPTIVANAGAALGRGLPHNRVSLHYEGPRRTKAVVCAYGMHLPCLFPQHGPGKKHQRPILLEPWQQEVVNRQPWALLRGLIESDGCRFVNRTGKYAYVSYEFSNLSDDIKDIFAAACAATGVEHRRYARCIKVYRRDSVALLEEHVGPKS